MGCRTMINFDCKPQEYGYGSSGSDGYGSSGYESSDSYGGSGSAPQYKCKRTPETKCYTTPRTVTSEYCEDREEEVCEKLTERVPLPKEKQVCHDEKKKKKKKKKKYSTRSNADRFLKPCATTQAKCHWYQAVFLLLVKNVRTILKSDVRMYPSNIVTKFRIK